MKNTTKVILIIVTVLLVLASPFWFVFYIMAFDAPGSYEDARARLMVNAVFSSPYLCVLAGWITYYFKRYRIAVWVAALPFLLYILLQVKTMIDGMFFNLIGY